jgi:hypothetical protein
MCPSFFISIPGIKEIHNAAKQLTVPSLYQFQVNVLRAATKHMDAIEQIVGPPLAQHRLYITLTHSHFRRRLLPYRFQKLAHFSLTPDPARIKDVFVGWSRYGIFDGYHSA